MSWIIYILVFLAVGLFLLTCKLVRQKAVIDALCDVLADRTLPSRPSWVTDSEKKALDEIVKDWNAYGYNDYRRLVIAGMLYKEESLRKSAVKGHFLEDDIIAPPSIQIEDWCGHEPGDEVDIIILNNTKK